MDKCLKPPSGLGERGFTLIELLIAVFLTTVGIAATIGVLGASGRTTLGAQRSETATQRAQAEIEKLSTLSYGQLALTSAPPASSDPNNPGSWVNGSSFTVRPGLSEQLVLTAGAGQTAKVDPGPQSFTVGTGGAVVTGKIYRFVSWHDERCPTTPLRRHREHQARHGRGHARRQSHPGGSRSAADLVPDRGQEHDAAGNRRQRRPHIRPSPPSPSTCTTPAVGRPRRSLRPAATSRTTRRPPTRPARTRTRPSTRT